MMRIFSMALSATILAQTQANSIGSKYKDVHAFLAGLGTNAEETLDVHRRFMQEEPAPETTEKTLADCFAACVEQQMKEEECIAYIHKILGEDLSGSAIPNLQILVHKPRPQSVKAITYYYIGIPTNINGDVHCDMNNGVVEYPYSWETADGPVSIPPTDCMGMNANECCDAIMDTLDTNGIPKTDVNGNCLSCWVHQEGMKPIATPEGTVEYESPELAADGTCTTNVLTTTEVATIDEGIQAQMEALKTQMTGYIESGATCEQLTQLQRDLMFWGRLESRAMSQISTMMCSEDPCVDGPLSITMIGTLRWIMAVLTGDPSNVHYLTIYLDHEGLVMEPPKIGGARSNLDVDRLDDCDGDEPPAAGDEPVLLFSDGTPIPEGAGVCDAVAMSEQSAEGESCYSCRTCLLEECDWTAPDQDTCHKLFLGEISGTSDEWLACLESNGVTDVLQEGATAANGFDDWCACAVKCEHRCLKDDLSYLKDPRRKECTADDMSKRSEENEHCYDCRLCLQSECLDTGDWANDRHWCTFLLKGLRNGRPEEWLACLESDGSSRTLSDPTAGAALIEENGGNRDTWGTCARRCDGICNKQPVKRANTEGPICTSEDLATQSMTHDQVCFPCRQCLRRQCDYWRDRCDSIVEGLEVGSPEDWLQCLHHCGGGLTLRKRALQATDGETERATLWCDCARECDDRCHHAVFDESPLGGSEPEPEPEPVSPYGVNWEEPLCREGDGEESLGTPTSSLPASYFDFSDPLNFRKRGNMPNGKYSDERKMSVSGGGWNNVLAELTDRPILDGETFEIVGSKYQVGVGLCIESCDMVNNKFAIRWKYNCVGFYGDVKGKMFATMPDGTEYPIVASGHKSSRRLGFTYDATNNCVTPYVGGYAATSCTSLPAHFEGKVVRAIGQVWNGASADLVLHSPPSAR